MKFKKSILVLLCIITLLGVCSCNKDKGVNILTAPEDYVGEFYVPSSKKVDEGTALSVVTAINEKAYKVETAIKTHSTDPEVKASFKVNCYGINIEIFEYESGSIKIKEAAEKNEFNIRDSSGKVLKTYEAVSNGNFVLMLAGDKNYDGEDCTKKNNKVKKVFKELPLK